MTTLMPPLFSLAPEKVFEYLFERLPVGTAVIDRDFRLRRCNPTWADFIDRYTPSSAADVIPGVSLFDLEPGTEDVLKPLFAPVFAGKTVRQEGIRLETGGIVSYWDVVIVPLEDNGQVVAALDVSMDVTTHVLDQLALEQTLAALRRSETNFRSLLENAQGYAIYRVAVDPDQPYLGQVILVSPSIREVTGINDPYDFSAWFKDVHPDDLPRIIQANREAMEQGRPFNEKMRFFHREQDQWRWVHTVSNPVFDHTGRLTHFNGITIDVTDQVRAQETLAQVNLMLEQQVTERTAEMERRHQELQALYLADEQLHQHLDLDAVLQSLVDVAVNVLQADKSSLMVWDEAHEHLVVRAAHGFHPHTLGQMSFRPGEGSVGRVAITGQLAVVEDTTLDEQVLTRITAAENIRSFMHFPITVRDQVFGVFNVDYTTPRQFSAEEQRLFLALAQRAGIAIENAQLYAEEQARRQEAERRRQVAESLRDTLTILNSSDPLEDVLSLIVQQARHLLVADACLLFRNDHQEQRIFLEASAGLPADFAGITSLPLQAATQLDRQEVSDAINAFQPMAIPDLQAHIQTDIRTDAGQGSPDDTDAPPEVKQWEVASARNYRAFLTVPLVVKEELYGSLGFYYVAPREFPKADIDLARTFSDQAALAIDNARLRLQAEQAAVATERNRLARELHDAVTQTLFSASLIADVLPRIWERNPELGREKLVELKELTRGALAEMRTLLLELRPATLTESSLGELLQQLAAAGIGRSRLHIDVQVDGDQPISPDIQVALYRIAQEALNNTIKHAGATHVTMTLRLLPACVELTITDNGRGFAPNTVNVHSLGLGIMRERAGKINADLQIHSVIGEGTTVQVVACA